MLLLISSIKLVAEIALMALLGQGVLGLLAGARRGDNLVYQLLRQVSFPFVRLTRWLTPRIVLDRHVPAVAFLWLVFVWLGAVWAKIAHCLDIGVHLCR
ncbi:MAG: hypothetical protein PHQ87_04300 [Hydrogenophaga sp.]|jgi:hypothetical protein|uniref:hypothetical protein n=1 Tax=Hydrogenophaga sp. TaxID=1904254 RepID=UPI000EC9D646|nr:hypothetical protein [Hydrogenophaga sp.]MDD3784751.1 hypothetical protein [Hydrogenophaga sp.]MDX9969716.1 hypothetical protein [Hydrogenophaga sp.]HAJ13220.1 hypothetical protein [Comamonadaceae bacterium]